VAEATPILGDPAARRRIGVVSMHTSPTASLGQNADGGLNVYVRQVASAFSDRGVATDIFTRKQSAEDPDVEVLARHSRVIYLPAGKAGLDKYSLYGEAPSFANRIVDFAAREHIAYDRLSASPAARGELGAHRPHPGPGEEPKPRGGRPPRTTASHSRRG
jgi:hypothetical protein